MTVEYPLLLSSSWPLMTTSFSLRHRQTTSRSAAGQLNVVDLGYPVWVGTYQTAPMTRTDCVEFEALLNSLGGATQMIRLGDTRREYPKAYPDGDYTAAPLIREINVDGIRISLEGLPANFVLSRGDYLTCLFGGRRYMMQLVESITADGAGETGLFQVAPPPPYGLSVGQTLITKQPYCRMRIEPGTIAYSDGGDGTGTISFSAVQV